MYSKVEYASWLKATYGLSESIRELVPILKVPPSLLLLELDPPQPAARIANRNNAAEVFLTSPPSPGSLPERGLVHAQAPHVGVERTTNPQREGSEVLPVAERELVEDGHPERLQVLLEHVLERP